MASLSTLIRVHRFHNLFLIPAPLKKTTHWTLHPRPFATRAFPRCYCTLREQNGIRHKSVVIFTTWWSCFRCCISSLVRLICRSETIFVHHLRSLPHYFWIEQGTRATVHKSCRLRATVSTIQRSFEIEMLTREMISAQHNVIGSLALHLNLTIFSFEL